MPKQPTCGHPDRKVFSRGNCPSCAQRIYAQESISRAQNKQRAQPSPTTAKPRKRATPETKLTKTLRTIYNLLRDLLLPEHTKCEGSGVIPGCTGVATEIHHAKGRRRYLIILSAHFKYLCHHCHEVCTKDSDFAKSVNLSLPINSPTVWNFTELELSLIDKFKLSGPK